MRGRPPRRKLTEEEERKADAFVGGAEERTKEENESSEARRNDAGEKRSGSAETERGYPWEQEHVRSDVKQGYALRLPEPLYLKLKYVSSETGESMNQLVNDAVSEMISRKLPPLT